jgi:hypothetical protein
MSGSWRNKAIAPYATAARFNAPQPAATPIPTEARA